MLDLNFGLNVRSIGAKRQKQIDTFQALTVVKNMLQHKFSIDMCQLLGTSESP